MFLEKFLEEQRRRNISPTPYPNNMFENILSLVEKKNIEYLLSFINIK